jgi:hypothetical protein
MLEMLEDRDAEREHELSQFSACNIESDQIVSSACPVLDGMYRDGGAEAIVRLTNFSPRGLNVLWMSVRGHVLRYWNVGRGKRSSFAAKDVFFYAVGRDEMWRHVGDPVAHLSSQDIYVHQDHTGLSCGCRAKAVRHLGGIEHGRAKDAGLSGIWPYLSALSVRFVCHGRHVPAV